MYKIHTILKPRWDRKIDAMWTAFWKCHQLWNIYQIKANSGTPGTWALFQSYPEASAQFLTPTLFVNGTAGWVLFTHQLETLFGKQLLPEPAHMCCHAHTAPRVIIASHIAKNQGPRAVSGCVSGFSDSEGKGLQLFPSLSFCSHPNSIYHLWRDLCG